LPWRCIHMELKVFDGGDSPQQATLAALAAACVCVRSDLPASTPDSLSELSRNAYPASLYCGLDLDRPQDRSVASVPPSAGARRSAARATFVKRHA
jgi:hypothetical protein